MTKQIINPERQEKKRIMKEKGMTGKQYQKWVSEQRRKGIGSGLMSREGKEKK
jgi:hypothetical protein